MDHLHPAKYFCDECGCLGADHITEEITITFSQLSSPSRSYHHPLTVICPSTKSRRFKLYYLPAGRWNKGHISQEGKKTRIMWAAVLAGVGEKAVSG